MAHSGQAAGNVRNSPRSVQTTAGDDFKRPASNSGTRQVPIVGAVEAFDNKSVRPGGKIAQPPKGNENGGRAGAKSGQEKVGTQKGTGHPQSGGELY